MHSIATRLRQTLAAIVLLGCLAAPGAGAQPIETIVQDDALLLHGTEPQIRTALERARALGMTRVRLTAGWSVIAPKADAAERPDFDAVDPAAYPDGRWDNLDRAVRLAHEAGLAAMIDIAFWAPRWATTDGPEAGERTSGNVDAGQYAAFAQAVATRYSGSWTAPLAAQEPEAEPEASLLDDLIGGRAAAHTAGAAAPRPLPAVDIFTIWNEPNHPAFLRPQWVRSPDGGWSVGSAGIYRALVRAAHPAIKRAAPGARVLVGGTAPLGSSTPGRSGVPPLRFLRELACVDEALRPLTTADCANFEPIPGDGWAHHPYSLRTTPDVDTSDKDKAPLAATARLAATLRALVDAGRLAPGLADLWLTEYGYETNAPDPRAPFSLAEQGHLLAWAEQIATSVPAVRSWPQFQLYDRPSAPPRPGMREWGDWQSGLYFADGSPKPAAAGYAMPVNATCARAGRVELWGRLRAERAANVLVERRAPHGRWRPVAGAAAQQTPDATVRRTLRHRRGTRYRLRWSTPGADRVTPAVGCATRSAARGTGRPRGSSGAPSAAS